jgi:hypothetical protein
VMNTGFPVWKLHCTECKKVLPKCYLI